MNEVYAFIEAEKTTHHAPCCSAVPALEGGPPLLLRMAGRSEGTLGDESRPTPSEPGWTSLTAGLIRRQSASPSPRCGTGLRTLCVRTVQARSA